MTPWYKTGTISVTNGSTAVTGSGTAFIANVGTGEALQGPDGKLYEIAAVNSDTSITLAANYLGSTTSGQAYTILPSQSYIRDLAAQAAALVNAYSSVVTGAGAGKFGDGTVGAPGISFVADTNTGIRRVGSDSFALVTGGADRGVLSNSGLALSGLLTATGINSTPIGSTTPSTGAFTTLSATGRVNLGASGNSVLDQADMNIGRFKFGDAVSGNTALRINASDTGNVSITGVAWDNSSTPRGLEFGSAGTINAILDISGNLGLGVVPSAWHVAYKSFDFGSIGGLGSEGTSVQLVLNGYYNTGWKYKQTAAATRYEQFAGGHTWHNSPSGTAGQPITFNQAMTLDASGNLGLGVTPSAWSGIVSKVLEFQNGCAIGAQSNAYSLHLLRNAYFDGSGWKYKNSAAAVRFSLNDDGGSGGFSWYTSPSGIAGATISFTQAMTLDASGNFLVGTTSAAIQNNNSIILNYAGGNVVQNHVSTQASGANYTIFGYNTTTIGSVTQTGTTAVAYNTTSDHRLKTNVRDANAARFMDVQFRDFEWTDGRHDCGVIAHELQAVYPDLVLGAKDATEVRTIEITPAVPAVLDAEGVEVTPAVAAVTEDQTFPVYQQVNYMGLIGRMGTVIQQQQRAIDALSARLTAAGIA